MKFAILSIIKDENEYLGEWINYHQNLLGDVEFYLFEDVGSTPHGTVCSAYSNVHLFSVLCLYEASRHGDIISFRKDKKQFLQGAFLRRAFKRLLGNPNFKADWLFIIDADEFLEANSSLPMALEKYSHQKTLYIPWHNFNANGHIDKPIGCVIENFTERCGYLPFDERNKCYCKIGYNVKLCDGETMKSNHIAPIGTPTADDIWLNHYITKSWEEYAWKILKRGMCHNSHRKLEDFFVYNPSMLPIKDKLIGKVKTVLVTGHKGFIGSNLMKRLEGEKYFKVIGFDQKDGNDINNIKNLKKVFENERPNYVVHLAALAGVQPSILNPREYLNTNVGGFLNILECCRDYSVEKLVYASSSSIYSLESPYAATKKMDEDLAESYYKAYGLKTIGLRLFTVYGENGRKDMAVEKFIEAIRNDKPIEIYGDCKRSFTYVGDVVEAITLTLNNPFNKLVYDVGCPNSVSVRYLAETIAKHLGKPLNIIQKERRIGDALITKADCSSFSNDYAYIPSTTIEQGIKKFA